MKKLFCIPLALVLAVSLLAACAKPNPDTQTTSTAPITLPTTASTQTQPTTTTPTQPTTIPTQPEDLGVEVEAQIGRGSGGYSTVRKVRWPIVITSVEELHRFADSEHGKSLKHISEFVDYYDDDTFFAEHSLVLIATYTEGVSSECILAVDSCVKKDGYYLINLVCDGEVGYDISFYRVLCIEVQDKISKYNTVFYEIFDHYITEIIR